jgi:apolipoprotein N-acyltransferase
MIDPIRRLSDGWATGVAVLSGVLLPLGFAPFGLYPLIPVSLAALWLLWDDRRPAVAARIGFAWGVGAFLAGTYWLYISIHIFGKAPAPLAVFLMLALVAIMAAYTGLAGYLVRRIDAAGAFGVLLVMPGIWVVSEWLRGWLFSGFPWLSLGYGLIDSPLSGFAPVLGVHGVSLAAVLLAGGLVLLLAGRSYQRLIAATLIAAILFGGQRLAAVQWTSAEDRQLRVALVQGAVPQDRKWLPSQLEPTKQLYLELTRSHWDRDLIVSGSRDAGARPAGRPLFQYTDRAGRPTGHLPQEAPGPVRGVFPRSGICARVDASPESALFGHHPGSPGSVTAAARGRDGCAHHLL